MATPAALTVSYTSLLERVGRFLFGQRAGYEGSEMSDIDDCIRDGLRRVYAAHDWSFFQPVKTITTVDGTSAYDLPTGYQSIESELHYGLGEDTFYPPVRERSDSQIRQWQQRDDEEGRPLYFSVRTTEFDPEAGSGRQLILYPTPDDEYTLYANMTLKPTMIDATNEYPVGGETLAAVITEACLAAAEHNLDDGEGIHEKQFLQLLPLAIMADQHKSSPMSLGPDVPADGRRSMSSYWVRAARMGSLSLDGETL